MKFFYILILSLQTYSILDAQSIDHYGAGQTQGIKVTASDVEDSFSAENTINGSGLDASEMEASRFLIQAAFGGDSQEIDLLAMESDYEGWIDEQIQLPPSYILPKLWAVDERSRALFEIEKESAEEDYFGPYWVHFQYAWWDNIKKSPDQLRHRVAYALSQLLVISARSDLSDFGEGLASYYDLLVRHAFGNYYDLLLAVALDPNMGSYLSHLNNYKSDPLAGTVPDENFAREIMQLFSVGLYELSIDGSRRLDSEGKWLPTYDNGDIRELAKVFTGLKGGDWSRQALMYNPNLAGRPVEFGIEINGVSREVPMQMDESQHESGSKTIIGDYTIPAGQSGMDDIEQAVGHLFKHPNVGPLVARHLIKQLIHSNPSPQYIARVARVFEDSGNGVRGDLAAVIKAVLLDEEARSCSARQRTEHGKLKEPILRMTAALHGFPIISETGFYWNSGAAYGDATAQMILGAPSVFNFYPPDYQPNGALSDAGLVGPEYQIHNSSTAIGYLNKVTEWAEWSLLFWDWHPSTEEVYLDISTLLPLAADPETLLHRLDVLFTHGRLSEETRSLIKSSLYEIADTWDNYQVLRTRLAIYLIFISPDFVILK